MNSPKDYLTDRQQKEKEMEQAEKMLIDTFGEEKARKLILDMKIGGILAGLQTNFMDLDTAQKKLLDLIQQSMEVGRENGYNKGYNEGVFLIDKAKVSFAKLVEEEIINKDTHQTIKKREAQRIKLHNLLSPKP